MCLGYDYTCVFIDGGVCPAEHDSTRTRPAVSNHRSELSPASDTGAVDNGEPRKQLYVLSDEPYSSKTSNTRFTRADSAIAFPRSLGVNINAGILPKMQAFAWNTGTRLEHLETNRSNVFQYLTPHDVKTFSTVYFNSVHPVFDLIDQGDFTKRASHCSASQSMDLGFQVVLCGVVALGSLFSPKTICIHEAELVEHARLTLDGTFAQSRALLSVDFVIGWILRAIYLRSTSTPHVSWMASSLAMHIAESIGLHQEMSEIKATQGHTMTEAEIETRRRTFWVASSLNRLFSAQYGRTMVALQNVTCRYPAISPSDEGDDFISLLRLLPFLCDATALPTSDSITVLTDGILKLSKQAVKQLPLVLLRADAIFSIYRKLKYIGASLSPSQTEALLSAISTALEAADTLVFQFQQWWTVIGVPFHSVCVLISLNTPESLNLLHKAMETLQNVAAIFSSHRSREALRTAQYLAKAAEAKKRKELESLQRCLNLNATMTTASPERGEEGAIGDLMAFEWPTDVDLGFSYFLDESYIGDANMRDGAHNEKLGLR